MKKVVKGDIFYADLRPAKGNEIGGRTIPVLVLQNNISNISSKTTIVAPISEKISEELTEYSTLPTDCLKVIGEVIKDIIESE